MWAKRSLEQALCVGWSVGYSLSKDSRRVGTVFWGVCRFQVDHFTTHRHILKYYIHQIHTKISLTYITME